MRVHVWVWVLCKLKGIAGESIAARRRSQRTMAARGKILIMDKTDKDKKD